MTEIILPASWAYCEFYKMFRISIVKFKLISIIKSISSSVTYITILFTQQESSYMIKNCKTTWTLALSFRKLTEWSIKYVLHISHAIEKCETGDHKCSLKTGEGTVFRFSVQHGNGQGARFEVEVFLNKSEEQVENVNSWVVLLDSPLKLVYS